MRKPHILSKKGNTTRPKRRIYFDTESRVKIEITKDEIDRARQGEEVRKEHSLYLVCASFLDGDKRKVKSYDERTYAGFIGESFWHDVDQSTNTRETTYVFAHNAKYDIQVSAGIKYLVDTGYEVVSFSDESPLFIEFKKYFTHDSKGKRYGKIEDDYTPKAGTIVSKALIPEQLPDGRWFIPKPKTKTIMLLSSTNYYQESLKKLGETFGIKKLEYEHTTGEINWEKAIEYCHVDVRILEVAMEAFFDFIQREDLGGFSITAAGQSFKAFRNRFLNHDIYIHDNIDALAVERRAYAGGRTEAFHIGKSPDHIYYVDVNSMYPAVMRKNRFPTKLVTYWKYADIKTVKDKIEQGYLICADVYLSTDENAYPYKAKKLLFPTGEFWTTLCTPELIYAIEHNHVKEIKNICIYEGEYIFTDFVQYFYRERLAAKANGDKVHDYLFKLMMNCLYGKFGQRNHKMIIVGTEDKTIIETRTIYDMENKEIIYQKVFGGYIWQKDNSEEASEAYNSFPAIAAHVTSYARLLLWDAIKTAGRDNVYYCDTDSLMVNDKGYKYLENSGMLDNKELGKLKLEHTGSAEWFGGKDYIFYFDEPILIDGKYVDKIVKIKGISKNAVQIENSKEGKLQFAVTMWGGFTPRLNDGDFSKYYNRVIIKQLKREYDKGVVLKGGKVKPHILREPIINKQPEQLTLDQLIIMDYFKFHKLIVPQSGDTLYEIYTRLNGSYKLRHFRNINGLSLNEFIQINKISLSEIINYFNNLT